MVHSVTELSENTELWTIYKQHKLLLWMHDSCTELMCVTKVMFPLDEAVRYSIWTEEV